MLIYMLVERERCRKGGGVGVKGGLKKNIVHLLGFEVRRRLKNSRCRITNQKPNRINPLALSKSSRVMNDISILLN